ncbi:hypothetical protein [Clostridium perfringens]|nr:hypothetical protein [Clostridium perfringens]MDM0635709.1 hypothetical protein [Clostridium perfringens]NGT31819.1 hypothetical protein [Clostridium perfringens]NGU09539.1 hypothetical protein [Clostridium perfringens]
MFKKESRYITRGDNEKLDFILWSMIDKLNKEYKLDCTFFIWQNKKLT